MELSLAKLLLNQVNRLDDQKILDYLRKEWKIKSSANLNVWGVLNIGTNNQTGKNFYTLRNVQTKANMTIEYPLIGLEIKQSIKNKGIYIPFEIGEQLLKLLKPNYDIFISCRLISANKDMRKQNYNPMLLEVDGESIEILKQIPKHINLFKDNDNLYIEENVLETIKKLADLDELLLKKEEEVDNEKLKLQEKKEELSAELLKSIEHEKNVLRRKRIELEERKIELKERQKVLSDEFIELSSQHNIGIEKLQDKEFQQKKLLDNLLEKKKIIIKELTDKTKKIDELKIKVKNIQKILKDKEAIMGEKLEKLRSYVKDKANTLLELEFIDQTEYNNLLMIKQDSIIDERFINFENDLSNDKQKAISHIQAYLFEKDIVYPRYILEDFLALIQTNDLIILAGESGSGKTNLIKSFAQAIGGKSFIIPVKPNWTSSEDLLGYYNPLEKKYLTTPFLEALLEAKDNPDIPYFICLDEMNLSRVEYYFADFLSLLEERGEQPEIKLYSEDESSHILSEFKNVMHTIEHVKEKYKKKNIVNFIQLLQDEEINKELTRIFGFSDKDSLIKYHTDLRRMLGGILNTPSSIIFPSNVRIIGAINIDETTHYLSPKILDRAHIMKFDSPLLQDWDKIANEIENVENKDLKIKFNIEDLGTRKTYPSFEKNNDFCKTIIDMTRRYFAPLGIEVGLRTIRQGLNYQQIFIDQGSSQGLVINNFILHKILPKMTFDGSKLVKENVTKKNVLLDFIVKVEALIDEENVDGKGIYVIDELKKIVENSGSNDEIVNYWA